MFSALKVTRNCYNRAFISTSIVRHQVSKPVLNAPKSKTRDIGPFGWFLLVCSLLLIYLLVA